MSRVKVIPVNVEGNSRELGPFLFCIYARIEGREKEEHYKG
jgi:hypothetical protein